MKKALVTGGAGFIGHHLVKELINQGTVVYLLDDYSNNVIDPFEYFGPDQTRTVLPQMISYYDLEKDSRSPQVILINGDFAGDHVVRFIESGAVDTVFHLAAKPRVEWAVENPIKSTTENFSKVLEIAKACSVSNTRLVFALLALYTGMSKVFQQMKMIKSLQKTHMD